MGRASRPASNWLTSVIWDAFSPYYIRPQLSREILKERLQESLYRSPKRDTPWQQLEIGRTEHKLKKELIKQSRLYANAVNRYNRKSLYEWFTGKSSRFDDRRRAKALPASEQALDNYNAAAGKFNDLREFIYNKYGAIITPPLDAIYDNMGRIIVRRAK